MYMVVGDRPLTKVSDAAMSEHSEGSWLTMADNG